MFTKIDSRIWSDVSFKKISIDEKLLFIYMITCKHRNMLGLYPLPKLYVQADLGWSMERVEKGFNKLLEKGFITYDSDTDIVFIKNFLKYNPLENPNQVKGAVKALDMLPTSAITRDLVEYLETVDKPFLEPLIKVLDKGLPKQEEVEVEVEVKEDVEERVHDDENNLQDLDSYYQDKIKRMSSSKDLENMLEAYKTYKDLEFIKRVMDKAISQNKKSHGELTIRSFNYFIPVLKEEWKKKQLGGGIDESNTKSDDGKNEAISAAERAGITEF